MTTRLKIPKYVKISAKQGLIERRENKERLSPNQCKKRGVYTGVAMANKICSHMYLDEGDLKRIARHHRRFRKCRKERSETAIKLWGGKKFGKLITKIYY